MERLTTNDPQGNVETAHNLFYAKDTEVWVRGGGTAPDYADITLYDFIRQIVQSLGPMSINTSVPDEELGEELYELLFDGTGTIEGLIATLYTAAWAFADLRNRLASYEDTGLEPQTISEILDSVSEWYDAHKEGRLIVPPCKVGDTVYTIIDGKIYEGEVYHISYSDYYGKVTSAVRAKIDFLTASIGAAFEDFGKTAFFTRAAAEAALKEREGK